MQITHLLSLIPRVKQDFQTWWVQLSLGSDTSVFDSMDAWQVRCVLRRRRMAPQNNGPETDSLRSKNDPKWPKMAKNSFDNFGCLARECVQWQTEILTVIENNKKVVTCNKILYYWKITSLPFWLLRVCCFYGDDCDVSNKNQYHHDNIEIRTLVIMSRVLLHITVCY